MIIDYSQPDSDAILYEILDSTTGEPLPMVYPWDSIYYADDEAGVVRHYLKDDAGRNLIAFESSPCTPLEVGQPIGEPTCPAWREIHKAIKIVPKERFDGDRQ